MNERILSIYPTLICILLLAVFVACSPTKEKIDLWGDSVNGEVRIAEVVADDALEIDIRVYAVLKLIRLGDVARLHVTLKSLPAEDRIMLIKKSAPEIGKMFQVPDMKIQASAKDALYTFMKFDNKALQASSKQAILKWYTFNFKEKYAAGKFSAMHVLKEIGAQAKDTLVHLLKKEPEQWNKIGKIIESINDPATIMLASGYFIELLEKQHPNFDPRLLQLLCYVRDDRATELLNKYVVDKKNPLDVRINAFNTLTFHPSPLSKSAATMIFLDRNEHIDMRGIAIELIRKTGDKGSLKYLFPYLKDEEVKWAVFGTILKLGGPEDAAKAISGLNTKVVFWRDDYDIAQRHLAKLDKSYAVEQVKLLGSRSVPVVTLALLGLMTSADAAVAEAKIKPMFEDQREIVNYMEKKKYTLGDMARFVYGEIGKRKK